MITILSAEKPGIQQYNLINYLVKNSIYLNVIIIKRYGKRGDIIPKLNDHLGYTEDSNFLDTTLRKDDELQPDLIQPLLDPAVRRWLLIKLKTLNYPREPNFNHAN